MLKWGKFPPTLLVIYLNNVEVPFCGFFLFSFKMDNFHIYHCWKNILEIKWKNVLKIPLFYANEFQNVFSIRWLSILHFNLCLESVSKELMKHLTQSFLMHELIGGASLAIIFCVPLILLSKLCYGQDLYLSSSIILFFEYLYPHLLKSYQ